jgi:TPR repeat protein
MTASGVGLTRDYRLARAWFGKAAAQEDPYGFVNLAVMYREGLGVSRDLGQARQLYEQAAKRGLAEAESALKQLGSP